jgi:5-methylcytosine-specific restriction protein A
MSFVDVGTTSRRKMTPTRALAAWERHKGVCVNCGLPIDGVRQDWFVEHLRALELGGADDDANTGPAHVACKKAKDADDHSRAAAAKRAKRRHIGIKPKSRLQSAGFPKAPPQKTASRPIVRRGDQP